MAPTETILISSSPRARTPPLALSPSPGAIQAMRSSSPGLPSPSTLFRPSDFRSGSCLAQSPKHAPLGFATASSIYQREQLQVKGDGRNKTAKAPEINGTEQLAVLENSRTGKPVKLRKPAITTNKEPRSKRGAVSVGAQGKSSATVEDQTTRIIQDSDAESIFEVPARKPSLDLSEYAFAAPTTNFTPDKAASPRKTVVKGKRAKKPSIDEHAPCKAPRSGSKAAHASVIEPTTNTDNKLAEDQIGNPTVEDSQFNGQSSKPSKRANPRVARDKAQKEPKPKKKRPKKSTSGEESRPEVPHDSFQEAAAVPTFKALSASIQESQTLAGEQYVGHSRDPTTSSEDIGLDRAPRRRLSWTPAKDTGLPTSFQERSSSVPITPPLRPLSRISWGISVISKNIQYPLSEWKGILPDKRRQSGDE
ncbi:hypothetical protein H2203_006749 [Taxawa tesnikishii (nom. ined.)]|nr:hypothetical protein H2203_006749 [Dothideales sp. JES 119]